MSRGKPLVGRAPAAMAALKILLTIAALGARAHSDVITRDEEASLTLEPELTGGFLLSIHTAEESTVLGHIGRTVVSPYSVQNIDEGLEIDIDGVTLSILTLYDSSINARGIKIKWSAEPQKRLEDCFSFGSYHWYGGPMQVNQVYPIQYASQYNSAYVSKEDDNGAIVERYWLNSGGHYIYINPEVPLFVDYHNFLNNHICFSANISEPYSSRRNRSELSYDYWVLPNVKIAHQHAVENYLGKPSGLPDYRMVQHPIWSTWAQYSYDVDDTKVREFANQINLYGFNNSQLEIDDLWEVCYGSLTINENKFPDFGKLVKDLKTLGFRVTLWVHPFINKDCDPWYTEALEKGYFVLSETGSPDGAWWNSNGTTSGYIDFTNPEAAEWWYQRVKNLTDSYDVDSFKFDAGETNWLPQIPVLNGDIELHPHSIVQSYVKTCARFGDMIEVRSGFMTQDLPIFVRMVDRDSIWSINNGLPSIITTTLQMNLNGYSLVLPDMIGGNGFNLDHDQAGFPTKELFIRWVQANTFLPAMQYSFVPWNFDAETVEICKKYTELHAAYADEIYAAMNDSVNNGTPVNPPIWWVDPTDNDAYTIWDEYLLGENILVAPVLVQGLTSRNIYLPSGTWMEEGDPERVHEGPKRITNHPAPLDTLPYFIRQHHDNNSARGRSIGLFTVTLGLAIINYVW